MTFKIFRAAAFGLIVAAFSAHSFAAPDNYEFQAVSGELKAGKGRVISVKLIDKRTKQPVPGATFVSTVLDMSPENMMDVKGRIAPDKSTDPAIYRFKADLEMSGVWALKLQAKIPNEGHAVQGVLILRAND